MSEVIYAVEKERQTEWYSRRTAEWQEEKGRFVVREWKADEFDREAKTVETWKAGSDEERTYYPKEKVVGENERYVYVVADRQVNRLGPSARRVTIALGSQDLMEEYGWHLAEVSVEQQMTLIQDGKVRIA